VTNSLFGPESISVVESLKDFSQAITLSAELLVAGGHAAPSYVTRVVENYQKLGPYFVVAPQIAIAHAAPSDDVFSPGLSLLKLNNQVDSGDSAGSPVSLVFSLCTPDRDQHIEMLGDFALLMSREGIVNSLLKASAESVIREILES
jgi:mannitol/fructose-specific phosphotransferase system IIA component (Ntr-type)